MTSAQTSNKNLPVPTPSRVWALLLLLVLVIMVSFLVPWRLNFMRPWVSQKVQESTGRALTIGGDLTLYWGLHPNIVAEDVRFANPAWGARPDMFTARRADATIALLPLFEGSVSIPALTLDHADVQLEEKPDGRRNWYLDRQQSDSDNSILLGRLNVNEGHIAYIATARQTHVDADVSTRAKDGSNRLMIDAKGTLNGLALKVSAEGDDILRLRDAAQPYGLKVKASIGQTTIEADGKITGLAAPTAADVQLHVRGASLGEWYRIAHVGVPETPPYDTRGHLHLQGHVWHYDPFTGHVGNSDIEGALSFEPRRTRPMLRAKLLSRSLDLQDFAPVVGKAPGEQAVAAPASTPNASSRILPQGKISTEKWNSLDADVIFEGRQIKNVASLPFERLNMHVSLVDAQLTLNPIAFGFAGGTLEGQGRIDGRSTPMEARLDAHFRGLQLDQLLPKLKSGRNALGRLNGKLLLDGRGNSLAAMLGSADGQTQLAMGRGTVSDLLLEIVGLDGKNILTYLFKGDENSQMRCAVADLGWKNGVVSTKTFVVDTDNTLIKVDGQADFAHELLDAKVSPLPKHASVLVLRVPFYVRGTFAHPTVTPDKAGLAARGGGAIALGLLNPLAALIPLIETGPGVDQDCHALFQLVKSVPVQNMTPASSLEIAPHPAKPGAPVTPGTVPAKKK